MKWSGPSGTIERNLFGTKYGIDYGTMAPIFVGRETVTAADSSTITGPGL